MKIQFQKTVFIAMILMAVVATSCSTSQQATISQKSVNNLSYTKYKLGNYYTIPIRNNNMVVVIMQGKINSDKYNKDLADAMVGGFLIAAEASTNADFIAVALVKNSDDVKIYVTSMTNWNEFVEKRIKPDTFITGLSVVKTSFSEMNAYKQKAQPLVRNY
jgi:hypothetical protein